MKTCSKCKEPKQLTDYYKRTDGRTVDGYVGTCKMCRAKYKREYRKAKKLSKSNIVYNTENRRGVWEVIYSPGDWPTDCYLKKIDIKTTLKMGYFDEGMRLRNTITEKVFEIVNDNGAQKMVEYANA